MTKVRHRIYREDFREACVLLREMTELIRRLDLRLSLGDGRDCYFASFDHQAVDNVCERALDILGQPVPPQMADRSVDTTSNQIGD